MFMTSKNLENTHDSDLKISKYSLKIYIFQRPVDHVTNFSISIDP